MPELRTIAIIGPAQSGKTQFTKRIIGVNPSKKMDPDYIKKYAFNPSEKKINDDYVVKESSSEYTIVPQWWDFKQDKHIGNINVVLKKASKICLIFDASDLAWQAKLNTYLETPDLHIPDNVPLILVGTKTDILEDDALQNLDKEVQVFSSHQTKKIEFYVLVSATTDLNLVGLREQIVTDLENSIAHDNGSYKSMATSFKSLYKGSRHPDEIDYYFNTELDVQDPTKRLIFPFPKTPSISSSESSEMPAAPPTLTSSGSNWGFRLRMLIGFTLQLAALGLVLYLAMIGINVWSAASLIAVVNNVIVSVGGLLGVSAPAAALGNMCAASGLSISQGSGAIALLAAGIFGGVGYLVTPAKPTPEYGYVIAPG